jgi:hypothetical protein
LARESGSPPQWSAIARPGYARISTFHLLSAGPSAGRRAARDFSGNFLSRGVFASHRWSASGLHRLAFTRARPFNEDGLRRISRARTSTAHLSALISLLTASQKSGASFPPVPGRLKAAHGDRVSYPPLPDCLVICATEPGRLVVARGLIAVATLHGGRTTCPVSDVLESRRLQDTLASVRAEILALHLDRAARDLLPRRSIDSQLISRISRHVVRRSIGLLQNIQSLLPRRGVQDLPATSQLAFGARYAFSLPHDRFLRIA